MSIGPLPADNALHAVRAKEHSQRAAELAAAAAGIGQADGEDHQVADRDGDGRRPWQRPPAPPPVPEPAAPKDRDPSGERGGLLDLSG
jgi:hypothetical protein